jgi:hypothetical protein
VQITGGSYTEQAGRLDNMILKLSNGAEVDKPMMFGITGLSMKDFR